MHSAAHDGKRQESGSTSHPIHSDKDWQTGLLNFDTGRGK